MEKFNTLQAKSGEIASFVEVINDIAARVNLLSLNASIEAARAGEHGRGFAVVAEEISKLADATARNSKEISNIIRDNMSLIDQSSELINESSAMMEKLDSAISVIKDEITGVGSKILRSQKPSRPSTILTAAYPIRARPSRVRQATRSLPPRSRTEQHPAFQNTP